MKMIHKHVFSVPHRKNVQSAEINSHFSFQIQRSLILVQFKVHFKPFPFDCSNSCTSLTNDIAPRDQGFGLEVGAAQEQMELLLAALLPSSIRAARKSQQVHQLYNPLRCWQTCPPALHYSCPSFWIFCVFGCSSGRS